LDTTLPSTSPTLTDGDTIDAKITLQDGTLLDETTSTFPITTQYVPPTTTQFNTPTAVTTESVLSTASTTTHKSTSAMNWVMPLTIVILLIIVVVLVMLLVIRKKR
jgi:disulfide bond formation protein DsbB